MVPSANLMLSHESFQHWFSRPCGERVLYSTYPSPSRSPYRSIHSSARVALGHRSWQVRSSPVNRQYSESRISHSGVASAEP